MDSLATAQSAAQNLTEHILAKWGKSTFLRLEVFAKHELIGFSKVFVKDYHKPSAIKNGEFMFGDRLTIS